MTSPQDSTQAGSWVGGFLCPDLASFPSVLTHSQEEGLISAATFIDFYKLSTFAHWSKLGETLTSQEGQLSGQWTGQCAHSVTLPAGTLLFGEGAVAPHSAPTQETRPREHWVLPAGVAWLLPGIAQRWGGRKLSLGTTPPAAAVTQGRVSRSSSKGLPRRTMVHSGRCACPSQEDILVARKAQPRYQAWRTWLWGVEPTRLKEWRGTLRG